MNTASSIAFERHKRAMALMSDANDAQVKACREGRYADMYTLIALHHRAIRCQRITLAALADAWKEESDV